MDLSLVCFSYQLVHFDFKLTGEAYCSGRWLHCCCHHISKDPRIMVWLWNLFCMPSYIAYVIICWLATFILILALLKRVDGISMHSFQVSDAKFSLAACKTLPFPLLSILLLFLLSRFMPCPYVFTTILKFGTVSVIQHIELICLLKKSYSDIDSLFLSRALIWCFSRSGHFIFIYWFWTFILFLSSGSPDDWECFLHYLGCLLEDDSNWCNRDNTDPIQPPKFVECKISSLADEMVQITLLFVFIFCVLDLLINSEMALVHVYLCVFIVWYAYF